MIPCLSYIFKVSQVSTTRFDSKFIHMVLSLTLNQGVDYVILPKYCSEHLPDLLADEAKIIITENTDISVLSSKFKNMVSPYILCILFICIRRILQIIKCNNPPLLL